MASSLYRVDDGRDREDALALTGHAADFIVCGVEDLVQAGRSWSGTRH